MYKKQYKKNAGFLETQPDLQKVKTAKNNLKN